MLLRATALLRAPIPQLIERVRQLEQIADGRLLHLDHGRCPRGTATTTERDDACRACQILGSPRSA